MEKSTDTYHIDSDTPPESFWMASTAKTNYPALGNDIKVDVAIVGGGIT